MGSLKALLIAGAVATGAASVSHAADLPPLAPTIAPEPEYGGWYIRGDVGVGSAILDKFESSASTMPRRVPGFRIDESNLDDSAFVDAGVGYAFNSFLRFDVTGEYRTSQRFQAIESYAFPGVPNVNGGPNSRGSDTYNASLQSAVFLANAYFDFGHWYGFTPYVGAGAGFALNTVASLTDVGAGSTAFDSRGNGGLGFAPTRSVTNFAFAGMAGVSYDITQNVKLDIGYRYLNMGEAQSGKIACTTANSVCERQKYRLASNDFRVGLRWMFSAPPPVMPAAYEPPPPPLVRKY